MSHDVVSVDQRAQLERRVQRERARREAAELIGDQVTADLFATITELQRMQAEMADHADRERTVNDIARCLGNTLGTGALLTTSTARIGALVGVDRCQVHLSAPTGEFSLGDWSAGGGPLRAALPLADLPAPLLNLLEGGPPGGSTIVLTDATRDPRLGWSSPDVVSALGAGVAALPVRCGQQRLGWLLLVSSQPRSWTDRDLAIGAAAAEELGAALVRLQAAEQRESVRRLEELDRAKDELLSNVSHELRTPLASIGGYAELLAAGDLGPLPAPALRAVEVMSRNVDRLSRLVENLLQQSAPGGESHLDLCDLDLAALVERARHALAPVFEAGQLHVSVTTEPELRPIRADQRRLEQVVHNLLDNAAKFTGRGGRVSVRLANTARGVSLTVGDTGVGIPTAEQGAVFSRFFRSSVSVSGEVPGTGLGLALTKSIVELHGGRISLTSTPGLGTTVRIELPALSGSA